MYDRSPLASYPNDSWPVKLKDSSFHSSPVMWGIHKSHRHDVIRFHYLFVKYWLQLKVRRVYRVTTASSHESSSFTNFTATFFWNVYWREVLHSWLTIGRNRNLNPRWFITIVFKEEKRSQEIEKRVTKMFKRYSNDTLFFSTVQHEEHQNQHHHDSDHGVFLFFPTDITFTRLKRIFLVG